MGALEAIYQIANGKVVELNYPRELLLSIKGN
jgi:hypothetical protein